jgi:uncharacterized protein
MHDPRIEVEMHASFETYKKAGGTTINHFHKKLLLLKDRMTTPTGRHLAEARHAFMEQFLKQFDAEWLGES